MKEPKIRFKGFRGEWETTNIASVASLKAGVSIDTSQEISFQIQGYYPCYGGNGLRGYVRDYTHDGIYNIIGRQGALCGNVRIATGKFHATEHAVVVTPIKKLNPYFLFNVLTKANINQYATGVAQPGLSVQNVNKRLYINIPFFDEQQSIASYFQHLDSLIQSTTKKIESLKQVKAASLQSMFPQEGETTPRVRFKGFEGEWEETTIGKVTSVKRGVRVTRKNLRDHGLYPVYQNTDYPMGYYNRYNVESNNPFVIIGGSAGLIGFCDKDFWAADDCAYFSDSVKLDKSYLYSILLNKSSEIKKNVRGSSVPRLDRQVINDLNISLPSLKEQRAIASYFTNLDRQITLQTQRLEKLKQIKAACLDKMFV